MSRVSRGPLVVLDVDSTLIGQEVVDLIAEEAGVGAEVAAITDAAMRGELDFVGSLTRRVALLEGLPESVLGRVQARITVTAGARALLGAVHASGGQVCAVSGGFDRVLAPLAEELGLGRWRANALGVADGRLTGRVEGAVVDAAAKRAALLEWSADCGTPLSRTVAIGDGANDLLMLEAAGLGIAFDAKPAVRDRADVVLPGRDLSPVIALLGLA